MTNQNFIAFGPQLGPIATAAGNNATILYSMTFILAYHERMQSGANEDIKT